MFAWAVVPVVTCANAAPEVVLARAAAVAAAADASAGGVGAAGSVVVPPAVGSSEAVDAVVASAPFDARVAVPDCAWAASPVAADAAAFAFASARSGVAPPFPDRVVSAAPAPAVDVADVAGASAVVVVAALADGAALEAPLSLDGAVPPVTTFGSDASAVAAGACRDPAVSIAAPPRASGEAGDAETTSCGGAVMIPLDSPVLAAAAADARDAATAVAVPSSPAEAGAPACSTVLAAPALEPRAAR